MVAHTEYEHTLSNDLPTPPSRVSAAWRDLIDGAGKSWMWAALSLQDIKLRYRGSVLGPFWLTISTLVMVVGMGVIYPHLFGLPIRTYLPYLAIGLIVWQFISAMITEGCDTFVRAGSIIQQVPIPYSIHAYQTVCRNLIVLGHNFVIIPVALVATGIPFTWRLIEVVPALALLVLDGLWISLLLGMLSARYRDIPPIIGSFLQLAFLLTPIFWPIAALGKYRPLAAVNPLFAAVDIFRAPLLGIPTEPTSWPIVAGVTIFGCAVSLALFARFRTRIAYWI